MGARWNYGTKVTVGDFSGGDEGTRTPDPRDANAVLSQLSYIPTGAPGGVACLGTVPESTTRPPPHPRGHFGRDPSLGAASLRIDPGSAAGSRQMCV
jgi:hypothetical protein